MSLFRRPRRNQLRRSGAGVAAAATAGCRQRLKTENSCERPNSTVRAPNRTATTKTVTSGQLSASTPKTIEARPPMISATGSSCRPVSPLTMSATPLTTRATPTMTANASTLRPGHAKTAMPRTIQARPTSHRYVCDRSSGETRVRTPVTMAITPARRISTSTYVNGRKIRMVPSTTRASATGTTTHQGSRDIRRSTADTGGFCQAARLFTADQAASGGIASFEGARCRPFRRARRAP